MKTKAFYEKYWKAGAPPEDDPTIDLRKKLLAKALSRLDGGRKVLDAACGSGVFISFIRDAGFDVHGLDISSQAIQRARARYPDVTFHVGSLEDNLPYKDGAFDAVWATEVLEHIFDVRACLDELNRVLRTDGPLIMTVPYHGLIKNVLIALTNFDCHYDPEGPHIRFFTKKSLAQCLRRSGFEPLEYRGIGRVWPLYKSILVLARKGSVTHRSSHD